MYIPGRAELDRRIAEAQETVRAYNDTLTRTDWVPSQTEQMTRLSARGMYLLQQLVFEVGQLTQQLEAVPEPGDPATLPQRDPGATLPADALAPADGR